MEIEDLRKKLFNNKTEIKIEDLGAGSRANSNHRRSVEELTRTAVKPKKYSQLLFRLVSYYKPQNIVELGTSLGITTSYLAFANPSASIITIEGSPEIAKIAGENFDQLQLKDIKQEVGNFDDILPSVIHQLSSVDLAYIDGNHRYQPTINYFHQFLEKHHNDTIMIFDDIHWSTEMERAWKEIKNHPSVRCTVDIFFLGFVFFRRQFKEKQHFTVRF